jgi:hypothetical protein
MSYFRCSDRLANLIRVCCTDDFNDDDIDRGRDIMNRERDAKAVWTSLLLFSLTLSDIPLQQGELQFVTPNSQNLRMRKSSWSQL